MRVLGVDGVRDRWVGVLVGDGDVEWVLGAARDVLRRVADASVALAAIDVPIGYVRAGSRRCEADARRQLGAARSSIFATAAAPAFALAADGDRSDDARRAASAASAAVGGPGVGSHSWGLVPKVLEVEDVVRGLGASGQRVVETHPETAFAVLAAGAGVASPAPKRSAAGAAQRVRLLTDALVLDVVAALAAAPPGVPVDDALDALAAAWSAARHARGAARVLGEGTDAVWRDLSPAPGRAVVVV
ncbi:DUF429 domain-containing protein [Aquipuribacter nitratireducens]|uniref:DUF429 domain-containing protein n=1 Tax=Aquipuribacter nitratireducens TaxID=650104 RepID=A0ABW0GLQ4_9MICO